MQVDSVRTSEEIASMLPAFAGIEIESKTCALDILTLDNKPQQTAPTSICIIGNLRGRLSLFEEENTASLFFRNKNASSISGSSSTNNSSAANNNNTSSDGDSNSSNVASTSQKPKKASSSLKKIPSCAQILFLVGNLMETDDEDEWDAVCEFLRSLVGDELYMFERIFIFSDSSPRLPQWSKLSLAEKQQRLWFSKEDRVSSSSTSTATAMTPAARRNLPKITCYGEESPKILEYGSLNIAWIPQSVLQTNPHSIQMDLCKNCHMIVTNASIYTVRDVGYLKDADEYNPQDQSVSEDTETILVHHGSPEFLQMIKTWLSVPNNNPQAIFCAGPDGSFGCTRIRYNTNSSRGKQTGTVAAEPASKSRISLDDLYAKYDAQKTHVDVYNITPFTDSGPFIPFTIQWITLPLRTKKE